MILTLTLTLTPQECCEKAHHFYSKLPATDRSPVIEQKITELVAQLQNAPQ